MSTKTSIRKKNTQAISWSDYEEYTRDIPRQWHDVPLLPLNEERAIISRLPQAPAAIIEVGAHNRVFSNQLSNEGYTVHTYDNDQNADVDTHAWNKLPPHADVIIAKQVFEHISAEDIPDFFSRFIEKSPRLVFTIPNYWAPSYVFLNDYTHINNQSLRTWVYWLRRAGYTTISFSRLGAGKKIPFVSVINRFLGGNDPCHSLIISAAAEKQ